MSFVISSGAHDFVSLIKLLLLTLDLPRGFFPSLPPLGRIQGVQGGARLGAQAGMDTGQPCQRRSLSQCALWELRGNSRPPQAFVGSGSEGKERLTSPATAARLSRLPATIFSIISEVPPRRL